MLRKYLKTIYLFRKQEADKNDPNYYPGQKAKEVYYRSIKCNVQPAKNEITSEMYGERVTNILSLLCDKDVEITDDMTISLSNPKKSEYKIISIEEYTRHNVIMIEAIL